MHSRSVLAENTCWEMLGNISASSNVPAKADALRRSRDDWFVSCNYFIDFNLYTTFQYWKPAANPFQFLINFYLIACVVLSLFISLLLCQI